MLGCISSFFTPGDLFNHFYNWHDLSENAAGAAYSFSLSFLWIFSFFRVMSGVVPFQ
jgi:hypothetical protein